METFESTSLLTEEQKGEFVASLEAALNLHKKDDGGFTWNCTHDYAGTVPILKRLGLTNEETAQTLKLFRENGGYCDCEIMLNAICGGDDDADR